MDGLLRRTSQGKCPRILSDIDDLRLSSKARHVGAEVNITCRGTVLKTVCCKPNLQWSDTIPACAPEESDGVNKLGFISPCLLVFCLGITYLATKLHTVRRERRSPRRSSSGTGDSSPPNYDPSRDTNNNPPPYFSEDPVALTPQTQDDQNMTDLLVSFTRSPRTVSNSTPQNPVSTPTNSSVQPMTERLDQPISHQTMTERLDQPISHRDDQRTPRRLPDIVRDDRPPSYSPTPPPVERVTRFPRIPTPSPPAYSVSADSTTVLIDDPSPTVSQFAMQVLSVGTLLTSDIILSSTNTNHNDGDNSDNNNDTNADDTQCHTDKDVVVSQL